MKIQQAKIINRDGRLAPFVFIESRWYCIETEPQMLALDVAMIQPVGDDFQEDWDAPSLSRVSIPADDAAGRAALSLENFTSDPEIVKLARRFYELASSGTAQEGPL